MRWCTVCTALARHAVEEVDEPECPLAEEQLHDVIDLTIRQIRTSSLWSGESVVACGSGAVALTNLGDAARAVVHGVEIRQVRHRVDLEERVGFRRVVVVSADGARRQHVPGGRAERPSHHERDGSSGEWQQRLYGWSHEMKCSRAASISCISDGENSDGICTKPCCRKHSKISALLSLVLTGGSSEPAPPAAGIGGGSLGGCVRQPQRCGEPRRCAASTRSLDPSLRLRAGLAAAGAAVTAGLLRLSPSAASTTSTQLGASVSITCPVCVSRPVAASMSKVTSVWLSLFAASLGRQSRQQPKPTVAALTGWRPAAACRSDLRSCPAGRRPASG
eukprot:COSAG04_NODE_646_length_11599_cov_28.808435_3_plen_334_part_00